MTLYRAIRSELVKLRHTPLLPIHIFVSIVGAILFTSYFGLYSFQPDYNKYKLIFESYVFSNSYQHNYRVKYVYGRSHRTFTADSIRSKQDNHFLRKVSCPFWWRRSFTDQFGAIIFYTGSNTRTYSTSTLCHAVRNNNSPCLWKYYTLHFPFIYWI